MQRSLLNLCIRSLFFITPATRSLPITNLFLLTWDFQCYYYQTNSGQSDVLKGEFLLCHLLLTCEDTQTFSKFIQAVILCLLSQNTSKSYKITAFFDRRQEELENAHTDLLSVSSVGILLMLKPGYKLESIFTFKMVLVRMLSS